VPVVSCASIVLLPVVFVAGHVGQSSSARYAMAGFGAWVAGRLVAVSESPVLSRLLVAVAAVVPLSLGRDGSVGSSLGRQLTQDGSGPVVASTGCGLVRRPVR
jgi:hypothetical protein